MKRSFKFYAGLLGAAAGMALLFTACNVNDSKGSGSLASDSLSYSANPAIYGVNVAIANNIPTVKGGANHYSVSPSLPAGLKLDSVTGVISGTPVSASSASNYTVTAGNASGSTTAALSIAVVTAPTSLSYAASSVFYATGTAVTNNIPVAVGTITRYSVAPALPSGLRIDTGTGVISGTPTSETSTAAYTVTARNPAGFVTAQVQIMVYNLQYAAQLQLRGNLLFVANRSATLPGVAAMDTATGKVTAYYSEQLPPSSMAFTQDSNLIITETNYSQGAVSVLNLPTGTLQKSLISFGSDNFTDTAAGKVYLFDHTTGVITGFTGHVPNQNVVFNVQTGASSDPYDIAVSNNLAFVTRYNSKSLLVLDATQSGGGTRDSVDLSAYVSKVVSDSAFLPRMASVTAYSGYVFVALQRLNYNYSALDTSLVVVINASTKQVVSTIPLKFKNPISAHAVGSTWYITSIANYDQSGGVEKIDLAGRTNAGSIVSAQSQSADLFDFVPAGAHAGYVAYSTDYGVTTKVKKISY